MCFCQFQCYWAQTSHFSSESFQTHPKRSAALAESCDLLGSASRVKTHRKYAFSCVSINFSVIGHIPVTFRHIRSRLTPNAWFCKQSEVTHSICIFMCFYQFQCYWAQISHFSSESMQTRAKCSVVVAELRHTQYMHFHMFLSISVLSETYQSLLVIFDP